MEQLLEFAGNHIALVAALAVILSLLSKSFLDEMGGKGGVGPQQATELINREDAVVVDLRSMADFAKGHIINSTNIPMTSLKTQMGQLEKYKQRPIILSCNSGGQSAAACRLLRSNGFEQVYNLKGGLLAWQNSKLPVSRKK
jgi:rhodanese-related sulfurtransferase